MGEPASFQAPNIICVNLHPGAVVLSFCAKLVKDDLQNLSQATALQLIYVFVCSIAHASVRPFLHPSIHSSIHPFNHSMSPPGTYGPHAFLATVLQTK